MARLLRYLIVAGLIAGICVTGLGLFADRWPSLELLNHGRPAVVVGLAVLVVLAIATRRAHLIAAAAIVAVCNLLLFGFALQGVASASTGPQQRFLRIVTFNLLVDNKRLDDIASFLNSSGADIAVLQEVTPRHRETLRALLKPKFPYMTGNTDVVIFAKYPPRGGGHINGEKVDGWARHPMLLWTTFDVDGFVFDLAGVHLAYPFNPLDQAADMPQLIDFARSRERPLIVAGDFNLTPWSVKLQRFTRETGLKRYNTFMPTWPMDKLMPFVTIDNVFTSKEFAPIKVETGAAIGSDHRPLIADIALMKPQSGEPVRTSANYP
jgi:endonuclease/exonuclease/phosphatase (EEP) superfamily protein YafD